MFMGWVPPQVPRPGGQGLSQTITLGIPGQFALQKQAIITISIPTQEVGASAGHPCRRAPRAFRLPGVQKYGTVDLIVKIATSCRHRCATAALPRSGLKSNCTIDAGWLAMPAGCLVCGSCALLVRAHCELWGATSASSRAERGQTELCAQRSRGLTARVEAAGRTGRARPLLRHLVRAVPGGVVVAFASR